MNVYYYLNSDSQGYGEYVYFAVAETAEQAAAIINAQTYKNLTGGHLQMVDMSKPGFVGEFGYSE